MRLLAILGAIMLTYTPQDTQAEPQPIINLDSENYPLMKAVAEEFTEENLHEAREVADLMYATLLPKAPAAGLAAPQIGISKAAFLFSYDRQPENLILAINPRYEVLNDRTIESWEACFSTEHDDGSWEVAKTIRHTTIKAMFKNLEGEDVEMILEGFVAKVFQHEWDHLQGIENIQRPEAETKSFTNFEELIAFFNEFKKTDAFAYIAPIPTTLYKVLTKAEWEACQGKEHVVRSPNDDQFIHLSTEAQANRVIGKFFKGEDEVVLLHLDPAAFSKDLVFESNSPGGDKYYHLYDAEVSMKAVKKTEIKKV